MKKNDVAGFERFPIKFQPACMKAESVRSSAPMSVKSCLVSLGLRRCGSGERGVIMSQLRVHVLLYSYGFGLMLNRLLSTALYLNFMPQQMLEPALTLLE